jgi:hypothetical protein
MVQAGAVAAKTTKPGNAPVFEVTLRDFLISPSL